MPDAEVSLQCFAFRLHSPSLLLLLLIGFHAVR